MKILLINPPNPIENKLPWFLREERHSSKDAVPVNPYMAPSILGMIRENIKGIEIKVIDALAEGISKQDTIDIAHSYRPDFIITLLAVNHIAQEKDLAQLAYPTIGIICPVAADPKEATALYALKVPYLINQTDEVEATVLSAVREFKDRGFIRDTPGITINKNGKIYETPEPQVSDMTRYPMPAFDLFPFEKYRSLQDKITERRPDAKDTALINTSKGCLYGCDFCVVSGRMFKPRQKNAEQMFREIKYLHDNFDRRRFVFINGLFGSNINTSKDFCNKIIESNLKVSFLIHNRIEFTDEELLGLLSKAGCERISYGIETADKNLQARINKNLDLDKAREVIGLTKKYGIKVHLYFMVGIPGETKDSLKKDVRFILETQPDFAPISQVFPEPGSKFYNFLKTNNLLLEEDWAAYRKNNRLIFKHDQYRSLKEIEAARRWVEIRIKRGKLFHYSHLTLRQRIYEYFSTFDKPKIILQKFLPAGFSVFAEFLRRKMVGKNTGYL